jgi:hypothetical protein
VAVKLGYGILRKPLGDGTLLEQYPFSVALGNALGLPKHHSESEYRDLVETYGPFNEAIVTINPGILQPGVPQPFSWNSQFENGFKGATLLMSPVRRLAFRFQDWWKEQEGIFPLYTKLTTFIAGLIVGGVIGVIIGRLTR